MADTTALEDIQNRIGQRQAELDRARAALAAVAAEKPESSNPDKNKAWQARYNSAQTAVTNATANLQAAQRDLENAKLVIAKESAPPQKAQTAEERVLAQQDLSERQANKDGACGHYLNDADCLKLQQIRKGEDVADKNANTAAKNADTAAAAQAANAKYQQDSLALQERLKSKEISADEYKTELTKLYNDASIEYQAIESRNKAATTLYNNEVTQRGQDLNAESNIRTNTTARAGQCTSFIQSALPYMSKGTVISMEDINSACKKYQDNIAVTDSETMAKSRADNPREKQPEALVKSAAGEDQVATVSQRQNPPVGPGEATSLEQATDAVLSKYNEWKGSGGSGVWDDFLVHDKATGGAGDASMPASLAAPPQAPPPANTAPAPVEQPATVAGPPPNAPAWMNRVQQQQTANPAASSVGGITINVGGAGQPQGAQPAQPTPADPSQDPDYHTAVSAATHDLLSGIVDPDIAQRYQVPQDQMGAFSRSVMGSLG